TDAPDTRVAEASDDQAQPADHATAPQATDASQTPETTPAEAEASSTAPDQAHAEAAENNAQAAPVADVDTQSKAETAETA
ncbi:MAG TPA: hypothetical protein DCX04_04570, partial [Halomonas sp.]|nr:hypothetical protein [Halomonas sp.]